MGNQDGIHKHRSGRQAGVQNEEPLQEVCKQIPANFGHSAGKLSSFIQTRALGFPRLFSEQSFSISAATIMINNLDRCHITDQFGGQCIPAMKVDPESSTFCKKLVTLGGGDGVRSVNLPHEMIGQVSDQQGQHPAKCKCITASNKKLLVAMHLLLVMYC